MNGSVAKLFLSKPGGLTVYQFDDSQTYCYYYAHLNSYAARLQEGMPLRKGDVLGYVGSSGNASPDAPHLHFAVFKLGSGAALVGRHTHRSLRVPHRFPAEPFPDGRGSESTFVPSRARKEAVAPV
jgi:hypothetical protein